MIDTSVPPASRARTASAGMFSDSAAPRPDPQLKRGVIFALLICAPMWVVLGVLVAAALT